jgi:hypothetical protein
LSAPFKWPNKEPVDGKPVVNRDSVPDGELNFAWALRSWGSPASDGFQRHSSSVLVLYCLLPARSGISAPRQSSTRLLPVKVKASISWGLASGLPGNGPNRRVYLRVRLVIRPYDERAFGRLGIDSSDCLKALGPMLSTAWISPCSVRRSTPSAIRLRRHGLDSLIHVSLFLANDLLERGRVHAGVLQFGEDAAGLGIGTSLLFGSESQILARHSSKLSRP